MEIGMNSSILGNKFGKWTVLELDVDSADKNYIKFICKCDCGKTKSVYKHHLTSNQSTSCGCSRKNRSNIKPKKDYFFTKSGPTAMFDIDDTLILWNTPEGHEDREVKIDCEGVISYRVPNIYNINLLKKFYESGHIVILWSCSGVRWCKAVAKALNIENYIDGCISKPQYYIDDKANPKEWIGKHGYFDYNGNRIHGDNFAEIGEVNE